MDITYLGAGCVKVSGKQVTVLSDPYGSETGLPPIKANADVVTLSSPDMKYSGSGMVVDGPGEYEVKGSLITGVPTRLHVDAEGERGAAYSIEVDDFNVVVLGNIAPGLSGQQLEQLGTVDVLVVPVGGHGLTLDATAAAELVSQIEPKFVVPVHFDDGKTKYAMPQEGLEKFLKEMGSSPEPQPKLKLSSKELPPETTVAVLQRSGI